ncbi:hypothetical protein PIB30_084223 [Stylosanthes scabra]|uniref:Uncharacterized protein n=1 Tax=Stylosanthes scabra TaxID=79078 RepID=A0ABU6WQV5_9FABA|nr:hypothetical protein [Stylosanthes scabra]
MSWENEDDSSTDSDDDEVANICLMANDKETNIEVEDKRWKQATTQEDESASFDDGLVS